MAACLGLVLAEHRGDRVVALDANPDAGTLADRLTGESSVTVRELLRDQEQVRSWTDMSRYPSLAGACRCWPPSRTRRAAAFSREEYEQVSALLGRFFDIVGDRLGNRAWCTPRWRAPRLADSVVVVGAPTVDGASRAGKTLDWLHAHGHAGLAADAVVVLSHDRVSSMSTAAGSASTSPPAAGRRRRAARPAPGQRRPHRPRPAARADLDGVPPARRARRGPLRTLSPDGRLPGGHPGGGPTLDRVSTHRDPASPWVFSTRELGRRAGAMRAYHRDIPAPGDDRRIGLEVIGVPGARRSSWTCGWSRSPRASTSPGRCRRRWSASARAASTS